jgi:hypothetical protein
MSNEPKSRLPSLTAVTAGFMFACTLVGAAIVFKVEDDRMVGFQEASLRTAVETRARGVQTAFAASLYREWINLETLGSSLAVSQPEEVQDDLSTLVGSGRVVSWAGYAGNDGKVRVASNGLLVGADVSSRPWFQRGASGQLRRRCARSGSSRGQANRPTTATSRVLMASSAPSA